MSPASDSIPTPIVIDVEASGFGPSSCPIEVELLLEGGTPLCFLVCPHDEWTQWDEAATQVHKIPREAFYTRGLAVTAVAEHPDGILCTSTVYSDGWSFDRTWLAILFEFAGRIPRFKPESTPTLLDEAQAALWHPVVDAVALTRHRASADASIVQQALPHTTRAPFSCRRIPAAWLLTSAWWLDAHSI